MTRSHIARIAALVVVGMLAGCPYDEYAIELTPHGEVMQRELTVKRVGEDSMDFADTDDGAEKLAAIAELYPQELETDDEGAHTFVGEFAYAMPDDVGGAGEYITFDTRMGRCSAYIERFGGDDAPAQRIQAAFDAADELTDIVIGWLEHELGEHEEFAKLRTFLDEQARDDLKNLSIASFLLDSTSSTQWTEDDSADKLKQEIMARAAQFILERQYVLPDEVPAIGRLFGKETSDGDEVAVDLLVNMLRRKADLQDEDMLAALGNIFADSHALKKSLAEYLSTTEAYQQLLAEWKQADDEPGEPEPMAVLTGPASLIVLLDWDIFGTNDSVKVALLGVPKPEVTNGLWAEDAQTVSWTNSANASGLPAICYAVWVEPDEEFQTQHFGKVILEGKDLADYCLWRQSLTDEEAERWDEIIDQVDPDDPNSIEDLRELQFSPSPAPPADDARGDLRIQSIQSNIASTYAKYILRYILVQ